MLTESELFIILLRIIILTAVLLLQQMVQASLQRHQGSWAAAARELKVDRANLQRLAKRLGIEKP